MPVRTPSGEAARGDGCGTGRRRLGGRRARRIPPPWLPPTFLLRQGLSLVLLAGLTGWTRLPSWIVRYGLKCVPGAAGAVGMGCIGFPNHPVWEVTTECNQECRHCHVSAGRPLPGELDTDQGRRLIDELAAVRAFRMLAYTGGEPLLRKDLFDLLAHSSERGFTNTLATNATLVDRSVARDLRRRGVAIAAVSLDGADPDTHDRRRGRRGSFETALSGMRHLREAGILLHVNITVVEEDLGRLQRLIALGESLGAGIILVYQLVPQGRGRALDGEAFGRDANERLMAFLAEAQRKSSAVLEPVAGPQYWATLLRRAGISGGPLLRAAEKVFHGCCAGRGFVYIKSDGTVWPCAFVPIDCGSVRHSSFLEIWERSPQLAALRCESRSFNERCGGCAYARVCGGCRGRAYARCGNFAGDDPGCFIQPPAKIAARQSPFMEVQDAN